MCKLHNRILNIRAEDDLTNDEIAKRMSAAYGDHITHDSVAKYFSAQASGIPIDKIESFLAAFGLKVVASDDVCVPEEQYNAMLVFAGKGMEHMKTHRD